MSDLNYNETSEKPITTASFISILAPTTSLLSIVVEPADGESAVQDAIETLSSAGGGIVQLTSGIYVIHNGIHPAAGVSNVTVQGLGDSTILQYDGSLASASIHITGIYVQSKAINNITKDDAIITFTTASDAANVLAGDRLWIQGTDTDGDIDVEWNIALSNGNGTTGEVALERKISRTMTIVTAKSMRGCENIQFKNFKMTTIGTPSPYAAIMCDYSYNCLIDNIAIENWDGCMDTTVIEKLYGINNKITNCRFKDIKTYVICFQQQLGSEVRFNRANNILYDAAAYQGGLVFTNVASYSCQYTDNYVSVSGQRGIYDDYYSRRSHICRNTILNTLWEAVYCGQNEAIISDNIIENCLQSGAIMISEVLFAKNSIVSGNLVKNCYHGVYAYKPSGLEISGNTFVNCLGCGIVIQGGELNQISNNIVRNCHTAGILLRVVDGVDSTDNVVANNIIDTVSIQDGLACGILLQDGSDTNIIVGNKIVASAQEGIKLITSYYNEIISNSYKGLGYADSGSNNDWAHNIG